MLEILPTEVREGLRSAMMRGRRRGSRLHLQLGDTVHPVLRLWSTGLALDAARTATLRGVVDLYDGPRHLGHCLIVASVIEEEELICEFKSFTLAMDTAPVDFEREGEAPPVLLSRLY